MFSFGTSNVLWKLPQAHFDVFKIITIRSIITATLIGILMLNLNNYQGELNDWLIAIAISLVSFLGLAFYNLSIKLSTVSQSITITSAGAIFGVLTSVFVYNEKLSWQIIVSLILIVIGLFLLENKKPLLSWPKGAFYAILASFFWGTTFALFRIPAQSIGSINFSFVLECSVLFSATLVVLFIKPKTIAKKPNIKSYLTIIAIACLGVLGVVFYNKAVTIVNVSILSVMGAFTPVISIVISHFVLKERFKFHQYLGMTLTLLAVLLLII